MTRNERKKEFAVLKNKTRSAKSKERKFWISAILIHLLLIILSFYILPGYLAHLIILLNIFFILAAALNMAVGFTGLLSLAHISLLGIGAYSSAILTKSGVPFIFAFLSSIAIVGIFSYILIYVTKNLKSDYLALATLGFSFVITTIILNLSITRGALGIPGIPHPDIFGVIIRTKLQWIIFSSIIMYLSIFMIYKITKSPFGRLLEGVRDDETSLKVMGKDTETLKIKAMVISGCFAGISGILFAHYITFIDPYTFAIPELIWILTVIIVGGLASNKGSIVGTFILFMIPELLRFTPIPAELIGPLRQIIYAIILLAILLYRSRGIFGRVDVA